MNCTICHQPLRGRYYNPPGTQLCVCAHCWTKLPRCSRCKKIDRNLVEVEGIRLCRDCMSQYQKLVLRCSVCRQPIHQRYIKPPGTNLNICPHCWLKVPHCSRCGRLEKNLLPLEGRKLCAACLNTIDRCAACQAFLLKSAYSRPGSDEKFCARCIHTGPTCAACHNPLGGTYRSLSDGRRICPECQATAITDTVQAETLYAQVKATCRDALRLIAAQPVPLRLVDAATLGQISSRRYRPEDRFSQRPLGLYYHEGDERAIYLETNLPRTLSLRTLAHEYGHAYVEQFDGAFEHPVANEGFAEWVAYGVLTQMGLAALTESMEQREDYYGVGLKWMLNLERHKGKNAIFALMRVQVPVDETQE